MMEITYWTLAGIIFVSLMITAIVVIIYVKVLSVLSAYIVSYILSNNNRGLFNILLPTEQSPQILFKIAQEESIQIRHFKQSKTTLEDVFVNVIGVDNDD